MNKFSDKILSQMLVSILEKIGINDIVISPGSRNAPLIIGFNQNNFFRTYSIIDERSAGFFCLGLSKQKRCPSVLVCTSGSALLNYYPAISEAFYSNIPMIVISADRPNEWIDQGDGQTIRQNNVFKNHIIKSYNLKDGNDENTIWYNERMINEGIYMSKKYSKPVHFNVPFSEPLYNKIDTSNYKPRIINFINHQINIDDDMFKELKDIWYGSKKRIILVGENEYDEDLNLCLEKIISVDNSTILLKENISNLNSDLFIGQIDKFISKLKDLNSIKPDLLVILGGAIISKKIKEYLRKIDIKYCWKFSNDDILEDTYKKITHIIPAKPKLFFKKLLENNIKYENGNYSKKILSAYNDSLLIYEKYLENIKDFVDLKIFKIILNKIPENEILHLSNSSVIRYTQLFDIKKSVKIYCNRGTSGIDGSTSTAIGFSQNTLANNTLITGDISFFYDSNALWNNYIKNNFKIIIINNGGGNIFRIIPGPDTTDELETFFESKNNKNAKHIALSNGLKYFHVSNYESLNNVLDIFWGTNKPCILEIFTDGQKSAEFLRKYMNF